MRENRTRNVDLHVDRIVVRARGSGPDSARALGAALAQALPSALAGIAERGGGPASGGSVHVAALPLRVVAAPRAADVAAAAGVAAAAALAKRLGAPTGGTR